jgi:hypothetical protein
MSFSNTLHDILDKIKHFIITDSSAVVDFIKPFVEAIVKNGGAVLVTAAENAVQVGFATPGDGAAKRAAALASFSAEVIAKEVPFIESQARGLIELALQKAKQATSA